MCIIMCMCTFYAIGNIYSYSYSEMYDKVNCVKCLI